MEHGIEAVRHYLGEQGIPYELVEHAETFTAAGEARAAGVQPHDAAKAVLLKGPGGYRLAVIPASERLDLHKVRTVLEATKALQLASEEDMARDFPAFEPGALPPFGPLLPAPEVLDRRLLDHPRILCSGGDHRHSLLLDPNDVVRAAKARIAEICED